VLRELALRPDLTLAEVRTLLERKDFDVYVNLARNTDLPWATGALAFAVEPLTSFAFDQRQRSAQMGEGGGREGGGEHVLYRGILEGLGRLSDDLTQCCKRRADWRPCLLKYVPKAADLTPAKEDELLLWYQSEIRCRLARWVDDETRCAWSDDPDGLLVGSPREYKHVDHRPSSSTIAPFQLSNNTTSKDQNIL